MIQPRFGRHTSAQINRLKLKALLRAKLLQLREDFPLQRIPLVLHVAERRADEESDDRQQTW
ncbi:MAG TPA: hypothetical protein PK992_17000 [Planctomycetaceae bacterium]|nr:hypothetical protein [Planctomycetaceae bacterium]